MRSDGAFWRFLLREMEQGHLPFRNTELVTVLRARFLKAFFDESGNHKGAAFFALTGFIGRPERWEKFDDEWRDALNTAKPRIKDFHAKKFFPSGRKRLSKGRR